MIPCLSCSQDTLATVVYRPGKEERHFCFRCEDEYQEARKARKTEPLAAVAPPSQPPKRRPAESLPFMQQIEGDE